MLALLLALLAAIGSSTLGGEEPDITESAVNPRSKAREIEGGGLGRRATTGNRVIIGVLADHVSIFDLGVAAYDTWYQDVSKFADVFFVIGECSYPPALKDAVLCLDTPDVYPPQVKEFKLWQYYARQPAGKYDFFFKIDLDTYVNARKFKKFIAEVHSAKHHTMYVGAAAFGRPEERTHLGLQKPYCLGLGYFATWRAVQLLAGQAERCMKSFVSTHSDTEIGRCFDRAGNMTCTNLGAYRFMHIYYQIIDGSVHNRILTKAGQSVAKFPSRPPQVFFDAALLHPIKQPGEMRRFHFQSLHYLRPILPSLIPVPDSASFEQRDLYELALLHLRSSCVHNTVVQAETAKVILSECSCPLHQQKRSFPITMHVLHRPSSALTPLSPQLSAVLSLRSVPAGPSDFLEKIRELFADALKKKSDYLGFFTEDVVLHCAFDTKLKTLLDDTRCAGHLFTPNYGGVLSLGAREWTKRGWLHVISDYQQARGRSHGRAECYNTGSSTLGTFAVIFGRATFDDVILWLNTASNSELFHHVLAHLSDLGHIVRTALPYIAIQDTIRPPVFEGSAEEESAGVRTASEREQLHRWTRSNYCHTVASPQE